MKKDTKKKNTSAEPIIRSAIVIGIFILGAVLLSRVNRPSASQNSPTPEVITGEKQVIDISVKGGYTPRQTTAKANVPSVLKMKTQGTFDCSSSVVIPALNYRARLPSTGTTEIEVPAQKPGTVLSGMCSMGMYSFKIRFD
ncbi:MAG: hypothetical protein A2Z96_05620 [Spirochaetes bacterium GWB1_48_6]|nr:MAG: Copper-transporting P-type ATPase (Modular protein) [Parcubacteria group bacterium GW2011_GWF1_45_5]KKU47904.1 MAG: Copper-transporting P-type ATPase (Modular protein) [Parcubacteria group bacterium GW2011_GWF2_46_8]OHD13923.1 MAG: hypothetical protein A2Z96_05620 [Spirochaetes bacterium GWB1_48_6]